MPDVKVPLALPGGNVDFTFSFPMQLGPGGTFPDAVLATGPISLVSVKAKADKDFRIGDGGASINFGAGGEGLAALGVYRTTETLLKDLKSEGFDEAVANLKNFTIAAGDNLLALRWGYGLSGNAKGQVAFLPGASLHFGAEARRAAISAVLHAQPQNEPAVSAIRNTLDAWKAPGQIRNVDQLPAKTSVITETTGKLELSLGMQYGYSYNWVKEGLTLGNLKGDLGLKIEAGISAKLGFTAEGRYALALTRESKRRVLRVQVFRLRQRGWGFAFHAGVSGKATKVPIPKSFDEFIKGVFNLQGQQVIKDIEKWLDTDRKLSDLLGDAAVTYGNEMFKDITGFDPIADAQKFVDTLRSFIDKWNELPADVSSLVYAWLDTKVPLADLRAFLEKVIASAGSSKALAKEIGNQIAKIDFFDNPIGKWLTAAAQREALSLLANIDDERARLVAYAKTTLAFIDGSELSKQLKSLQKWVNDKIGLDKIEEALDVNIDAWLKKRLSDFLDDLDVVKHLDEIRKAIKAIRDKWDTFYDVGYKALTRKYNFDVNYAFQNSTTNEALIDLTIDFSKPNAEAYLADAISGKFSGLLAPDKPIDGVTLHSAVLTHGIKRRTNLEVDSPFYKLGVTQINESLAEARGVDTEDGRLWVFNLHAVDIKRRKTTLSKLSVSAQLTTRKGNLRVFDEESYTADYKYMLAEKHASTRFVERRMELGVDSYLKTSFPSGNSFSDYLIEIDKFLDKDGVDGVGNIVAKLDVSLPGRALAAFRNLPLERNHPVYKDISVRVQKFLRRVVPLGYIFQSKVFEEPTAVLPLLVYSSLPLFNPPEPTEPRVFYWDFENTTTRAQVLTGSVCKTNLLETLRRYRPEIPSNVLHRYEDGDVDSIIHTLISPKPEDKGQVSGLVGLCDLEYSILRGIAACAKTLDTFKHSDDRAEQLEALSKFGSEFTETFNEDLGGFYAGKSLRPLGGLLILEIARLLDGNIQSLSLVAMLETMVVKPSAAFDPGKILDGKLPAEGDLLLHQRILGPVI
jgi:hypothetical protein